MSRVERSLGPFENPCRELREFRNHHEITEEEDKYLRERTTKGDSDRRSVLATCSVKISCASD